MLHPDTTAHSSVGGSMLLAFADPAQEAAFKQRYAEQRLQQDEYVLKHGTPFILLAALRSLRNGDWRSVAISSGEAALFAALTKVVRHRSATYLRHRSLLLTLVYLGHFTLSRVVAHNVISPGCLSPFFAAWREVNLSQLPWIALISLSLPLLTSHAAVAQALVLALSTIWMPNQRREAFLRCPATEEHYRWVANGLAVAAACVLPPPLGKALLQRAARLGPAAFYAVHVAAQAAVNYVLVLAVLHRWELQERRAFARQRRLAADAAALARVQSSCMLPLSLLALAFALLWSGLTVALAEPGG